ncbi:NAD(P)(+) transhydrogenase (Re/Si-specific) subunit beta, partial [Streptomyces scabiei]
MTIALAATLVLVVAGGTLVPDDVTLPLGVGLLVAAIVVGAVIGLWRARVVEMTGMPELIALLHSFVGLAAVLVGWN